MGVLNNGMAIMGVPDRLAADYQRASSAYRGRLRRAFQSACKGLIVSAFNK